MAAAVGSAASGRVFGVLGERSLHEEVSRPEPLSRLLLPDGQPSALVRGNLAVATPEGHLTVAADWLSCFPMYYAEVDGGLVFSSHLQPLARAIGAAIDPAGVVQFLTQGYCLNARTPAAGVRRLLPGQQLAFDARQRRLRIIECSELWVGEPDEHEDLERIWDLIVESTRAGHAPTQGLMLSAGWDSRVLLAALMAQHAGRMLTVSHGQPDQFELRMARRLAAIARAEHVEVPLGDDALGTPASLDDLFRRSESLMFPYWQLSGAALASRGAAYAACGVLGEVLGGHYGAMGSRAGRLRHVLAVRSGRTEHDTSHAVIPRAPARRPWYLDAGFFEDHRAAMTAAYEQDREETIARYARRGIRPDCLVEAFVTEHRAVQMIAQQPLAAHARLPVVLPFADRRLLAAVTRLPMRTRLQNELSRRLLSRYGRALLKVPLAATGLPAGAPILMHDAGRACRRAVDVASSFLFFRTHGRVGRSRPFGWMNFEQTLRPARSLRAIVDDLRTPMFDREAMRTHLDRIDAYDAPVRLAHTYLKSAQIDRYFRTW
jgi:hypothetical protein